LGQSWHGRLVQEQLPQPRLTWESKRKPREDKHGKKDAPDWLNASEYKDDEQVLAYKIRILANLLRCSTKTLAYTGAGLSVDAGIDMAAAGATRAQISSPLEADPTIAHCIMAELNNNNLLHGWVQQNHDGLPQKAGYRQEDINEIHGSWYDPSNPVVLYSGSLRGDLFADMRTWANTADLVLVLGTSLSGLNADQCVAKTAGRSLPHAKTASLGSVIISPQRSPQDGEATLRIFATADEVMVGLAKEFNLQARLEPGRSRAQFSRELCVRVPYDRHGKRSDKVQTWWDLRPGATLKVSQYNNIEGAQQPAYLGITPELKGEALPVNNRTCCLSIRFPDRRSTMQLGIWWIDAALRGGVEYLPVVNTDAVEEAL
jgi:NAD-dependent SIR2 family protein deacetylase